MKKFLLFIGVVAATILNVESANAQVQVGKGQLSGSLESNNIYYMADKKLDELGLTQRPELPFGSHDFIKLDYTLGRFSAGIQIDGYLPTLDGYDINTYQQRDSKLTGFLTKYVQWEDSNYGVRLGDIYEQFGNGLIFRTYEDRALAFNNSLAGARAYYNFNNYVSLKAVAGMPRLYDVRSKNWVWGADLSVSLSDIIGWQNGMLNIEGSYVGRHQKDVQQVQLTDIITNENLNMVSGRVNLDVAGFSLRGEYAQKLNLDVYNPNIAAKKGNVVYLDLGYNYKRFSASATFRRMDNMQTNIEIHRESIGGGNVLNYIPLLTRQYTYMLANLNPYRGCSAFTGNEIGGQVDLYYSLRNPKARTKYWNFHLNFSTFNSIKHLDPMRIDEIKGRNAWFDINFDVERQWSKKLKTVFLYSHQRWDESLNHFDGPEAEYCNSDIFVVDLTYKFNKKHSLRVEAQWLTSNDYEGDWVAALVEYNIAPMFSVYVSDMWNCESTDHNFSYITYQSELLHYYQVGASFTYSRYRAQISYGRNRAGYVCSGGVCRYQPAYTGINLSLTASF